MTLRGGKGMKCGGMGECEEGRGNGRKLLIIHNFSIAKEKNEQEKTK